jgi:hypothetical protein
VRFNGVKTAALIAALSALMLVAGWAFGRGPGLFLALLLALGVNGAAYFFSDRLALRSMRAHPVGEVEAPVLYRLVRELSVAARRPMPRLYVSETAQPNAFATGRNPRNAAVCCTRGILRMLDERELRAVLGHELSHVYNRDILIASVAAGIATVITYLSQLAIFLPLGRSEDDDGPGLLGALLMLVLGPVAAAVRRAAHRGPAGARVGAPQDRGGHPGAAAPAGPAARHHQLADDRQPVPGRGHRPPVLHAPADRRAHRPAGAHGRAPLTGTIRTIARPAASETTSAPDLLRGRDRRAPRAGGPPPTTPAARTLTSVTRSLPPLFSRSG